MDSKKKGALLLAGGIPASYFAYKYMSLMSLKHFKTAEFRGEWVFLSVGLLQQLDHFREILGFKVSVSSASGSMIRWGSGTSQHYFGRAIDIILGHGANINVAIEAAKLAGFKGIGIYPNSGGIAGRWRMHLDIRPEEKTATWGYVNGSYVSMSEALNIYA